MTKFLEWLAGLAAIIGLWLAVLCERMNSNGVDSVWKIRPYPYLVLTWPIILVAIFGVYSLLTIARRVYDFNNCPEAAEELLQQIKEAKADLKLKGLDCDTSN